MENIMHCITNVTQRRRRGRGRFTFQRTAKKTIFHSFMNLCAVKLLCHISFYFVVFFVLVFFSARSLFSLFSRRYPTERAHIDKMCIQWFSPPFFAFAYYCGRFQVLQYYKFCFYMVYRAWWQRYRRTHTQWRSWFTQIICPGESHFAVMAVATTKFMRIKCFAVNTALVQ